LDPKQPPVKQKPFAAILSNNFVQKVELILPEELLEIITKNVLSENTRPAYNRVIIPLKALLEERFFNEYIKKGRHLMLKNVLWSSFHHVIGTDA
jgi:ribonuclease P/MRP protein subunit RPP40